MAEVKHAFTSAVADGGDVTLVRPSNWNADHLNSYSVVNVKTDYGAVGDDSTNDRAAIQNAIDSLPTTADGSGGTVYFPPGVYRVTTALNVPAGVRLLGHGVPTISEASTALYGSVIKANAAGINIINVDGSGANIQHGPTFEGLGFHTNFSATAKCINLRAVNRVNIINCSFRGDGIGIYLNAPTDAFGGADCSWHNIIGCHFTTCDVAIDIRQSFGFTMVGGEVTNSTTAAVRCAMLGTDVTQNCKFVGVKFDDKGIIWDGAASSWTGCTFELKTSTGVAISNTSGNLSGSRNSMTNCLFAQKSGFTATGVTIGSGCNDTQITGMMDNGTLTTRITDAGTRTRMLPDSLNTTVTEPGHVFVDDTGQMTQPSRLTLSAVRRLTERGTGRLRLSDASSDPSLLKYRAPGSAVVMPDEYTVDFDRTVLNGTARRTMVGTGRVIVTHMVNNGPQSRLVLAGRG